MPGIPKRKKPSRKIPICTICPCHAPSWLIIAMVRNIVQSIANKLQNSRGERPPLVILEVICSLLPLGRSYGAPARTTLNSPFPITLPYHPPSSKPSLPLTPCPSLTLNCPKPSSLSCACKSQPLHCPAYPKAHSGYVCVQGTFKTGEPITEGSIKGSCS